MISKIYTEYILRIISLLSLILILISCGIDGDTDTDNIIYEELDEIEFKLQLEIGNDNDFFFGQIRDLIIVSNGTILVSDWDKTTIEQFQPDGTHTATVATAGRGPGELSSFFMLQKGAGDTLIVRQMGMHQQIDYFSNDTDSEIYSYVRSIVKREQADRFVIVIGALPDTTYLARTSWITEPWQSAGSNYERYGQTPISIVDNTENILQDSLHVLKGPKSITYFRNGAIFPVGVPPFLSHDRLRFIDDGRYAIARPDSMVIHFFNANHLLDKSLELNVKNRPIEKEDIQYKLRDIPPEHHSSLEEHVPSYKPAFLNIWVTKSHILLHTNSKENGKEFVVLTLDGDPEGRFYLTEFDEVKHFTGNHLYTIHKSPTGHTVRKYSLGIL